MAPLSLLLDAVVDCTLSVLFLGKIPERGRQARSEPKAMNYFHIFLVLYYPISWILLTAATSSLFVIVNRKKSKSNSNSNNGLRLRIINANKDFDIQADNVIILEALAVMVSQVSPSE